MTWAQRQRVARAERLDQVRADLAAAVATATGGALQAGQARELLEQALVWNHPRNAHELHRHLAEYPEAFTRPDPHCPLPLAQLLRLLDAAGHGDRITLLACAGCGSTDQYLRLLRPAGRICENCRDRPDRHVASRSRLTEVQADLVDRVRAATGDELGAEQARALLHRLPAFSSSTRAHQLRQYLAENPEAFTQPQSEAPVALTDLLRYLHDEGQPVTLLACAGCRRTDRPLRALMPDGARACVPCANRARWKACDRCGHLGLITAIRADGRICSRCYRVDPEAMANCAKCGSHRLPHGRRADGSPLCQRCAPRSARLCAGCGQTRPITANTDNGPLCDRCYTSPARRCGVCGDIRPINLRATADRPDTCGRCYRHLGDCTTCGRHCDGSIRDGRFYCETCYPGRQDVCVDCTRTKRIETSRWPVGLLCAACRARRTRNPAPCARCQTAHVLVGRNSNGAGICGPCSGRPELDWACQRCGQPGDIYTDGCCTGCVVSDRLDALFDRGDGTVATQLAPLVAALKATDPWNVQGWLRRSTAALLAELAEHPDALTHATLDVLPQNAMTRSTRATLVTTGVLPERHETLAQLELWAARALQDRLPRQLALLRPFVEWDVLRGARRRARRGAYTAGAALTDRQEITAAIILLDWLDDVGAELATATPAHLERWIELHPAKANTIGAFLRWARARRINTEFDIPRRPRTFPEVSLDDAQHHEQLRRCLTDENLSLDLRIAGALVRLYALPLQRLSTLPRTAYRRADDLDRHAYLVLGEHPVLLPPSLARLIDRYLADGGAGFPYAQGEQPLYLLRGRYPRQPRNAHGLASLLAKQGLYTRTAHNTAMFQAVSTMPPTVVADLFGITVDTAVRWAHLANTSWDCYLDALTTTR